MGVSDDDGPQRRRKSSSVEPTGAGCFGFGVCDYLMPTWLTEEREGKTWNAMFHSRAIRTEDDDEAERSQLVRLTDQLDKLKRAKEHISYGPTKKRLDSKIKQLQAELDEVVETVLVG